MRRQIIEIRTRRHSKRTVNQNSESVIERDSVQYMCSPLVLLELAHWGHCESEREARSIYPKEKVDREAYRVFLHHKGLIVSYEPKDLLTNVNCENCSTPRVWHQLRKPTPASPSQLSPSDMARSLWSQAFLNESREEEQEG